MQKGTFRQPPRLLPAPTGSNLVTVTNSRSQATLKPGLKPPPIRRLSPAEHEERKSKGLCFIPPVQAPILCVSTGEMMKLRVLIEGTPLLALVDTGSTHNFINTSTALGLALPTAPRPGVKVVVANGDSLSSTCLCEQVLVSKGSDSFLVNLFQIPLFLLEGKLVSWSSDTPHALAVVSSLLPASNKDILSVLLSKFDPLFWEVSTLPPSRSCDHRIILSAGSDPVAVRPNSTSHQLPPQAFKTLKYAITSAPVLQLPDFTQSFVVECDASGSGVGAVLQQVMHPIAFFSKKLVDHHQKLAAYERELIGSCKKYSTNHAKDPP
nr:AC090485_10 Putative retroelement [Ipomoea batatas]